MGLILTILGLNLVSQGIARGFALQIPLFLNIDL